MRPAIFLKSLLFSGALLMHLALLAQSNNLPVNLPAGLHFCGVQDSARLTASVSGGAPPYRYVWSMEPVTYLSYTFHASDFLDDTSRAQPLLRTPSQDSLYFRLSLRDSLGTVATDSMLVTFSQMGTHLGQWSVSIEASDTVQLPGPNVNSSYPLDSVEWSPARGLVNRHALRPLATPDSSVTYRARIWDSQGCSWEGAEFIFITVNGIGLEELSGASFEVFPTPLRPGEKLQLRLPAKGPYQLILRDARGREVASWLGGAKKKSIILPDMAPGIYFLLYQGVEHSALRRLRVQR